MERAEEFAHAVAGFAKRFSLSFGKQASRDTKKISGPHLTRTGGINSSPMPANFMQSEESLNPPLFSTLEQIEVAHINRILNTVNSLAEAAQILGIDPATLYRKRKKYHLPQ